MSKIFIEIFQRNMKTIRSRQDLCWIIIKNKEKFINLLDSNDHKICQLYFQEVLELVPNHYKGNKICQFLQGNKKVIKKFLTNIT